MKWVTALDLEQWADTIDARTELIGIVADLIRASVTDIKSFRFPSGDSGQLHGWDGRLHSVGGPPYVPQDESAWEFGTTFDYVTKINSDYTDRTGNPRGVDPKRSTFVFVTPRTWATTKPTIDEWKNQKRALQEWKDIAVIDGVAIEDWLDRNEAVAFRVAVEVLHKMPPVGIRSTSAFWNEYSSQFRPELKEEVLLAGRQDQATNYSTSLRHEGRTYGKAILATKSSPLPSPVFAKLKLL